MQELKDLFISLGLELRGYDKSSRSYRPSAPGHPEFFIKVFQEKDIPIQVAVGNYDLGLCGSDWVEELLAKFSSAGIVKIKRPGIRIGYLYAAACSRERVLDKGDSEECLRLASEYPNIAELYALKKGFHRYSVFPLWGSPEAYPPENAEVILLPKLYEQNLAYGGLEALDRLIPVEVLLIANEQSWAEKDLSPLLDVFSDNNIPGRIRDFSDKEGESAGAATRELPVFSPEVLRLALPDGHQQAGIMSLLERAGLEVPGYKQPLISRRLDSPLDGIAVKVIRPQDMPQQVALGNFDLAITGQDWLKEHLLAFPSSPVQEIMKLGVGKVRVVAAVSGDLELKDSRGLEEIPVKGDRAYIRVASEYVNIAESYARENHFNPYKVIPTWGASESFLPEDADLLIENIETGKTLQAHNLVTLDTLFESEACLIGSKRALEHPQAVKAEKLIGRLKKAIMK